MHTGLPRTGCTEYRAIHNLWTKAPTEGYAMPAKRTTQRRKDAAVLRLDEENWGERVNRAYRRGRRKYGITYDLVADRISPIEKTTGGTLVRLGDHEDVPGQARTRKIAWLALISYGFDPADFGLTTDNVPLAGLDIKAVRAMLDPAKNTAGPANSSSRCTLKSQVLPVAVSA